MLRLYQSYICFEPTSGGGRLVVYIGLRSKIIVKTRHAPNDWHWAVQLEWAKPSSVTNVDSPRIWYVCKAQMFTYERENGKFVAVGTCPFNQTPCFFFYMTNVNFQLDQTKENHSAAPPGIEPGSSECRQDGLTTDVRSDHWNCVQIFVFDQARVFVHLYEFVGSNLLVTS